MFLKFLCNFLISFPTSIEGATVATSIYVYIGNLFECPVSYGITSHIQFDNFTFVTTADFFVLSSESTSIPKNPRTDRPVGYAFVDLSTPTEAERAIAELSGKEILERKVSVQLARKPEPAGEKGEGAASGGEGVSGGEGGRRRPSGRGRGRGRGRGSRGARAGRGVSLQNHDKGNICLLISSQSRGEEGAEVPAAGEILPLTDTTNQTAATENKEAKAPRAPREPREPRRERGPPADGIPSKNKVMVANLPYDLSEEKVGA
jgi:RNA recognition motif-containing protein